MVSNAITRIVDTARIHAPGAGDGVMRLEFFAMLKEFFQRSDSWRQSLTINVEPGCRDYDLVSADHGFINRLMFLGRMEPEQANPDLSFHRPPPSARSGELVRPGAFDAVLRLHHMPQAVEPWVAEFSMTVCDPTDEDGIAEFPGWIAEKYQDGLVDGLLMKLMAHPAKPYSNKELAMYHGRKFNVCVGQARTDTRHGNTYGSQRWQYPQQFRSRTQRTIR